MPYDTIAVTEDAGLGIVTLDRPAVMNALDARMRAELLDALRRLAPRVRALVLTGAGRGFCSGQDLGAAADPAAIDLERTLREEYEPLLRLIHDYPVPVLAAVNGAAAGAGANLALAADVVVATESAVFVQAFARIGLIPDAGGTFMLPRLAGLARAMGMALFAGKVTARQAADWGLIWEAVPDGNFAAVWRARARALAEGPTVALAALRGALRAGLVNGFEAQLALEARLQGACGASADFREGVAAFLEKRPPRFEGR
ncbi:MAG: enoyl-CoA hydratase/isomerase family protein [Rhodobacteraceae bacterium]|nr:enoyl-CoA hydratase/isomerase family protein [Paracoccaceae bacterium]